MRTIKARVERVIDGDTIVLEVRARLLQDAPELNTAAGRASMLAQRKRLEGKSIDFRIVTADAYGRAVIDIHAVTPL